MTKRFSGKQVLSNFIRHADSHNKVQEEREMWRLREIERGQTFSSVWESRPRSGDPLVRGRLFSDTLDSSQSHHDSDCNNHREMDKRKRRRRSPSTPSSREDYSPNHWTKELMKAEENDPSRWGHTGYKELYPEDFASAPNEHKSEIGQDCKCKKRKKKSVKKRRKEHEPESGDDVSERNHLHKKRRCSFEIVKKRKSRKREHSHKRKRHKQKKKRASSPTDSSDDSHSSADHTHNDSDLQF